MGKTITIDGDKLLALSKRQDELDNKEIEIKGAALNDALCSYSYELLKGKTKGDTLSRKGAHIIHDDLQICFDELAVFFADLDDAYGEVSNTTPLAELQESETTDRYFVTGFNVSGVEENRSVILSGYKEVRNGVIKFQTPKIKYSGSYLYLSDLKERVQFAIDEVEQYMNGKTAPQEDPNQAVMDFAIEDDAFEKGKVV